MYILWSVFKMYGHVWRMYIIYVDCRAMIDLYVNAIRSNVPFLSVNLIDMFNDKLHVTYTYLGWCAVIIAGWHWPRCKMSIVSFSEWLVSYVCYLWRLRNFPLRWGNWRFSRHRSQTGWYFNLFYHKLQIDIGW